MPRTDEAPEAMLTIDPLPLSSIPGRKARMVRCIDLTLRSNEKSQSASEGVRTVPWGTKPGQLKGTRSGPSSRARASTASFERTSSLRLSASRPSRPATSMSVAMTRAPSRAKASAVARPMPAAAAVNNATLAANRPAIGAAPSNLVSRGLGGPRGVSRRHRGAFLAGRRLCRRTSAYCQDEEDWHIEQRRSIGASAALLDGAAIAQLVEQVIGYYEVGSSKLSCGIP